MTPTPTNYKIYKNPKGFYFAIKLIDLLPYIATDIGWQMAFEEKHGITYYPNLEELEAMLQQIGDKLITLESITVKYYDQ